MSDAHEHGAGPYRGRKAASLAQHSRVIHQMTRATAGRVLESPGSAWRREFVFRLRPRRLRTSIALIWAAKPHRPIVYERIGARPPSPKGGRLAMLVFVVPVCICLLLGTHYVQYKKA